MSVRDGRGQPLWPFIAGLGIAVAVFELTSVDLWLQDFFFDFRVNRWLVDAQDPTGRVFFYTGPKVVIIAIAAALLALGLGRESWRARLGFDRREIAIAILALASVPALIGLGKQWSNVFCPSKITRYGGHVVYAKLCSPFPPGETPDRRGHCFPAGHASGGFALLGLAWLRRTRTWFTRAVIGAQIVGWTMGLYQMLKGAHYLSHTVVTMIVSWIIVLLWQRVIPAQRAARAA